MLQVVKDMNLEKRLVDIVNKHFGTLQGVKKIKGSLLQNGIINTDQSRDDDDEDSEESLFTE